MSAVLYRADGEVLVDDDAQAAHLSNLTRAVLMLLAQYGNALEIKLQDGAPPMVRAHLQEQFEAVEQLLSQLMAGAAELGFLDVSDHPLAEVEVPR